MSLLQGCVALTPDRCDALLSNRGRAGDGTDESGGVSGMADRNIRGAAGTGGEHWRVPPVRGEALARLRWNLH